MISLEQLHLLRELVGKAITRLHTLERENAVLRDRVKQYEGNLSSLSDENQELNKAQNLVQHEVSELLVKLENLDLSLFPDSNLDSENTGSNWNFATNSNDAEWLGGAENSHTGISQGSEKNELDDGDSSKEELEIF